MSQENKLCPICGEIGHSKFYCRNKPIDFTKQYENAKKIANKLKKPLEDIATGKKLKKRKVKSLRSKAKDDAWDSFSRYIRTRDSLKTTGTLTYCVCVTCRERGDDVPKEYKHIQAGHAVGGRGNAILFHEEIVNGQCDYCNSQGAFGLKGDYGNYAIYLVKEYGIEHAQELQRLKGTYKKYTIKDLIEIKSIYDGKYRELLETTR